MNIDVGIVIGRDVYVVVDMDSGMDMEHGTFDTDIDMVIGLDVGVDTSVGIKKSDAEV